MSTSLSLFLLSLSLLTLSFSSITNTTDFYAKQLNIEPKDMHFQCYAGKHISYQKVMKRLIGIMHLNNLTCFINCLVLWDMIL